MKQLHEKLDRDKVLADAMQSRINALTADFVRAVRSGPARRYRRRPQAGAERARAPYRRASRTIKRPSPISTKKRARLVFRPAGCGDRSLAPRRPIPNPARRRQGLAARDAAPSRSRRRGITVIEARDQPEAVAALQTRAARRRPVRPAAAERRRFRRAARRQGTRSRAAGHRDDGVRQHPGRRRRDERRRARFPRQAGRSRPSAADGRARARAAPARDREHAAQRGARGAARRAADRRRRSRS